MKNSILINLSLVVFSSQLIVGCADSKTASTAETTIEKSANEVILTDAQAGVVKIQLGDVTSRSVSGNIRANGVLDVPPKNMVSISAPLGGFVKQTELLQGMAVKAGQLLVVLEHPDYIQLQQDYLDQTSQLVFVEQELHRQEELSKENISALKSLQQTKANFLSIKSRVEGLRAKLEMINIDPKALENGHIRNTISITSPIDGFVSQVNVNLGMHVTPNDVMLKIVDTRHVHAEAQVFEKDIPKLRIGQRVLIRLSNDNRDRPATVYLIGKEITAERTVRVHCHLSEEDAGLIPGTYFGATIETGSEQVSTVPASAVVNYGGKQFVFWEKDSPSHRYELIPVVVSGRQDDVVGVSFGSPEVLAQLRGKIVFGGSYELLNLLKNVEN